MKIRDCRTCRWRIWKERPKGKADPCGGCVGYDGTCFNWTHRKLWQIIRDTLEYTRWQIKERRHRKRDKP